MSDFFVMPHTPARILRVGFTLCSGIFIYNKCICYNVARCQRNNHSQDASDCGVIYIPPLFVSSQTKRAYICSKRDCKSFVKTQTKAVRFSKLRMPQWFVGTRTIWSELGMPQNRTLWTNTIYLLIIALLFPKALYHQPSLQSVLWQCPLPCPFRRVILHHAEL